MPADRPWLRRYDADVPHTLEPYPERTLLDELDDALRERPRHTAVWFKGTRLSYADLARESDAFASGLLRLGVRRGERVALLLPNCPQFLTAQLGAWKIGAITVPINPLYTGEELAGPLRETGSTLVVALTRFYEQVKAVQDGTPLRQVIATRIKEHLPRVTRLLFTLLLEKREGHRVTLRGGDVWFQDVTRHGGAPPAGLRARPEEPAVVLMSGGTTGAPKGVVMPHRAMIIAGLQIRAWYGRACETGADTLLLPLPLFHSYGCVAVQVFALLTRSTLALVPDPRDLKDLLRTLRRVRPTILVGVPTLYNALLNQADLRAGGVEFRSLKMCMSGASPLLLETKRRFEELAGCRIVEGYSLTESGLAIVANPLRGENKIGSVGLPLPDVEMRIVDVEEGVRDVAPGEAGEILLRAPQIMPGYWGNPEESARVLRVQGGGRPWLYTGDIGYLDPDGYLFLVDRKKDLIKPGGLQVWPREVEEALAAHPAVAEVGVAGVMDEQRGEIVKAWIVTRAGVSVTAEELRAWCRERLAPFKVPARVAFRDELPKSLVGKVVRRLLVEQDRAAARG